MIKLSFSACNTYKECPRKYQLQHIEGLREENTSSAFIFGRAIDEALNELLLPTGKQYLDVFLDCMNKAKLHNEIEDIANSTKVNYFLSDIDIDLIAKDDRVKAEAIVAEYQAARKTENISRELKLAFNDIARKCIIAKGTMILLEYEKNVKPLFKRILEVQRFIQISNEVGDRIVGFLDMVAEMHDGRIVIFDHKTSKDDYPSDSVANSEQLATYKIAMEKKYQDALCGYIVLRKKIFKRDPKVKIQVMIDNISEEFIQKTVDSYDQIGVDIKAGKFSPNWKACENAAGFRCPFYKLCHEGKIDGLVRLREPSGKESV